ncbi:hypothetical protein TB1_037234 [Malus domestica]
MLMPGVNTTAPLLGNIDQVRGTLSSPSTRLVLSKLTTFSNPTINTELHLQPSPFYLMQQNFLVGKHLTYLLPRECSDPNLWPISLVKTKPLGLTMGCHFRPLDTADKSTETKPICTNSSSSTATAETPFLPGKKPLKLQYNPVG